MFLSNAAIRNRTTIGVLIILIILAGVYSYVTLPRESEPDVKIPIILVTTVREGVSPTDIESSVTMKIEEELTGLDGVKEIRSSSEEGVSTIVIEFDPDVDEKEAKRDVKDKVDQARGELPTDIDEPVITEINVAEFPVMMINISGDVSPVRLKVIADLLEDTIKSNVPGILDVNVLGALEREIRIEVDPDKLSAYNITFQELLSLIRNENVNVSAGGLETAGTKFNVRIPAEFVEPGEVQQLQLTSRDGKAIYLVDIAEIKDTFKDRTSYSRLNSKPTLTISIQKRIGANIVDMADAIKFIKGKFEKEFPYVEFRTTLDQSKDIRQMVSDLENNIFSGLVLVVLVLVAFMGFRTSMIVAAAIPMSMLISFAVIQMIGLTLNMIVLFSLILALGMLVDNAIVIVENIYRYMQMGYHRKEAAMKGTAEVAWPVITSTATTLAAFCPLLFWPGIMGDFLKYLPMTLIITLSSSLFVAMVINPVICSVFSGGAKKLLHEGQKHPFIKAYKFILAKALAHRITTISLAIIMLFIVGWLYTVLGSGVELFPDLDANRALVNIRCPQGTNIQETNRLAKIVEEKLQPYNEYFDDVITTVGSEEGQTGASVIFGGSSTGPHSANVTMIFPDFDKRERPSDDVLAEIREKVISGIPGAEIKAEEQQEGPPTGDPVTIRIMGEDFDTLQQLTEKIKKLIINVPGLVNLRSDYESTKPELPLYVDRQRAMQADVNTAQIGEFLKSAVFGSEVGKYRQFNDEYDITIRLPEDQRSNIEDIFRLHIPNKDGEPIPLSSLGHFDYKGGYGTISRIDQKRVITITGGAEGRLGTEVLADVTGKLEGFQLPPGYEIKFAGEKEEQEKASAFLTKAFIIAILAIVIILVMQFNTLSAPLIIMTTVILSLVGVLTGLIVCHMPFGIIMTGIGVISLAGVVVNNAIVLLDYTRQLQREGMELIEAALQAGATRLRPVMLTAITTILGLVPMATGFAFDVHSFSFTTKSESSQWWASMAIAVIFGLSFATVLTLIVVPTLYVSLQNLAVKCGFPGVKLENENNL